MSSGIGLTGNLGQSGSRVFIVGGASGIDTQALIEAAVSQRLFEADQLNVRIDDNFARKNALGQLQTLGQNLQNAIQPLTQNLSVLSTETRSFDLKSGTLQASAINPNEILNATVGNDAENGIYSLTVQQKAQSQVIASDSSVDSTTALGLTGDFDINLQDAVASTISVTATDTLDDIATKINVLSSSTDVSASVIKIADNDFQLVLTGTETGKDITLTPGAGDNVLQSIGILDGANAINNEVQVSLDAIVDFNGVTITRDSNTIDDLINGVTIDVFSADPLSPITLNVGNDAASVKDNILNFVEAYNAFIDFVDQNQVVSATGEIGEDAVLFGDNLLRNFNQDLQSLYGNALFTTPGGFESLGDIGLTVNDENKLVISDALALDNALLDDFESIQQIFQSQASFDNNEIRLSNNVSNYSGAFVLDITTDGAGNITGVSADGDATAFTIQGNRVVADAGSIYNGLSFTYVGTNSATINVDVQQGFADQVQNVAKQYADPVTGALQLELLGIDDQNNDLSDRIIRIEERADALRERLITQYGEFEARLQAAEITLRQLRALIDAQNADR